MPINGGVIKSDIVELSSNTGSSPLTWGGEFFAERFI